MSLSGVNEQPLGSGSPLISPVCLLVLVHSVGHFVPLGAGHGFLKMIATTGIAEIAYPDIFHEF